MSQSPFHRPAERSVTQREKTRERVRRHRAGKKQAAAIEFVRTDASLFLHPDRLSQKAGAPKAHLRRMAIKELVDNALDAAATVTLVEVDINTFVISDNGPGIAPEKVVELFSVTRPMMSTKLIRRPTRGMVGNGLRVATGAAFASGGKIIVESRKVRQELDFDRTTGETIVTATGDSDIATGTRITIRFGDALPIDPQATAWGNQAIQLAGPAAMPMLTHPNWYSAPAFKELIEAARGTAQDLANLFGVELCNASGDPVERGQSDASERYIDPEAPASELSLDVLNRLAPPPPKLLPVPEDSFGGSYKIEKALAVIGGAVPVIVQVWARQKGRNGADDITLIVNRTPTVAELSLYSGGDSYFNGCGLFCGLGQVPKGSYHLTIAITTPAIALISDGKTPDLTPFRGCIAAAIGSALRKSHRPIRRGYTIKDAAYLAMAEAYLKASAGGTLPANARQIMYAARPAILEMTGHSKLNDVYFTQTLLPAFMEENPETSAHWDVVYDARGHLVEPHTDHSIPLGTLHVREYLQRQRRHDTGALISTGGLHQTAGPGDRYGAVLFLEKEGFEPLLRATRIAERFDIAVMSTKGMSVVAARALVDRLSAQGLPILVAHDLDIAGIRIFGTLGSDSTRYTFTSTPDIRRLGLRLEQAAEMRLQAEHQQIEGNHHKVMKGLQRYGATHNEVLFLADGRRVELNAMSSDQFIEWLEAGLVEHGVQKVIPSVEIIEQRARHILGLQRIKKEIADLECRAREQAAMVDLPADLAERIRCEFERDPSIPWEDALGLALDGEGDASQ